MAITNPVGWLPYGATDTSILLQHPLTSDPSTYFASISTHTKQGSGHIYDSILGFCPNGAGNHRLVGLTGNAALDNGGQISFEVTRAFVCEDDSANFSFGYTPASADEFCLSYLPTTGTTGGLGVKSTTKAFYSGGDIAPSLSTNISSAGKGDYVTVNFGWEGGRVGGTTMMAIDGKIVDSATRNAATLVGALANFYVGCDRGTSKWMSAGYYIRNLQISTRPPMFPVLPKLRYIAILSDSLCNSDDPVNGTFNDAVTSYSMRQRFAERGLFAGTYNVSVNGGHRLDNSITTGTVATLSVTANNTFHRSSGSFVTDGFTNGSTLQATGFVNTNNNALYTINTVTATDITITTTSLTVEGAPASASITGAYLYNNLTPLLALNPTVVVIRGGTNDAQGSRCSTAGWQTIISNYITACFAVPSVKIIVLANIPSAKYYSLPQASEIATGNVKLQAAADAWRVANPSDPRQIVVVDCYGKLGGENPLTGTFIGQVDGLSDNLHLSAYGHFVHGRAIADGIISVLN